MLGIPTAAGGMRYTVVQEGRKSMSVIAELIHITSCFTWKILPKFSVSKPV